MATRDQKEGTVEELASRLRSSSAAIVADYRGFTVAEMAQLRGQLRPVNVELKVAKNTLARRAAAHVGIDGSEGLLSGPTAIAFCSGDFRTAARTLVEIARTSRKPFELRGGFMGTQILDGDRVRALPSIPSQEMLYAQVLGGMQAPVSRLAGVLNATVSSLVYVLARHAEARQGGVEASAA